ncbi:hypothetical protein CspeluHIS016_0601690 [Cutaneotrichosporon spelunceum]|uniref:Pali-domain-containing protein n=1 Tax=Cutaneotrichosporon spelunceum TaxID=1672016 RepID=A0AAD3TXJ0_9TREE|nr:hypothetical protein CspeluHIS016_0601690 [Cutaneotrichosporon spelunceum]
MQRWERSTVAKILHSAVLCGVFTFLLLATLSTPILGWSYLTVEGNGSTVSLGTFGWCRAGGKAGDFCSGGKVGYDVQQAVLLTFPEKSGTTVRGWYNAASNGLLGVPIGCGLAGIAALASIMGKSAFAVIWATIFGILTCLIATGNLILNVLLFGGLKRELVAGGVTSASYGKAYYFVLIGCAVSTASPLMVALDCCAGRVKRWRHKGDYNKLETSGNSARDSTYRTSAYELPIFDAGQNNVTVSTILAMLPTTFSASIVVDQSESLSAYNVRNIKILLGTDDWSLPYDVLRCAKRSSAAQT